MLVRIHQFKLFHRTSKKTENRRYLSIVTYDLRHRRQSRNRCIRSKISRYNLDRGRVKFGAIATPAGSRWSSNDYITRMTQTAWESWGQLVGVRVAVRGSENQLPAEGLGLQDPRLSNPAEWERCAAKDRGTWGLYVAVCSVSNSPLTHNPFATLSNKVREVYFF